MSSLMRTQVAIFMALCCALLPCVRGQEADSGVYCVCRCCYQGNCANLRNVSWSVATCGDCVTSLCNTYIAGGSVRQKTAQLFDSLQNDVPAAARTDLVVDVCEVITVLETATCSGSSCKRTTSLKAECYNRNSPLMKYAIQTFVVILVTGTFFGFVKNYIPSLQEFNAKYFNY